MHSHRRHLIAQLAALAVWAAAVAPAAAVAAPPPVPAGAYTSAGTREAWYELRLPAGTRQGIVLSFHGGGWEAVGPGLVRGLSGYRSGELQRKWRARGFITVTSSYRAGADGFTDVVSVYDQLHARYPQLPIGAYGHSAGAHLALLLGAARQLAFVVSDAGPTNWASWKSSYPCYYKDCGVLDTVDGQPFRGMGANWVDVNVANAFGAASDPAPNMEAYDVAPNYDATHGPDPFLIYGRRALTTNPSVQIDDGSPTDGGSGNAYVDVDNTTATLADQLEADQVVPQQQGILLARRVGPRAILRTLPKGGVPWIHGLVDGPAAAAVYDEMVDWSVARAAASAPAPPVPERRNVGLANLDGQPLGTYVVRGCNAAPGRTGVFATGAWTPTLTDVAGIDAAESGCSTTDSAVGAGEGMQMRTEPSASDAFGQNASAAMTFSAPPGTTISSYGASYHGARTSDVWEMSLAARDAAGASTTLAECAARAPCATRANHFITPDTTDATSGPYPPQTFGVPAGTVALTWQLACRSPVGCPGGSSGNAANFNQHAFLNVYASAVYINDPADPAAPGLTGDFGDGRPHRGPLTGTAEASDTGAGVRRIEATFAGRTQETTLDCDYSRPRPCPATASLPISGDTTGLTEGGQPVTVTVTDGSGRSTTTASAVRVQIIEPVAFVPAVAPPSRSLNPFSSGNGREQLASCSTGPSVIAATLAGRRLEVTAVASARLAGKRATLKVGARTRASATIGAGGVVRLERQLRRSELSAAFTVSAGGRSSPRLAVRGVLTLSMRRAGNRIRLSGTVRRGGRRVEIQRLVACGQWRTVATVSTSRSGRFRADLAAAAASGGAYRARVAAPRALARSLGSRRTSLVAVV